MPEFNMDHCCSTLAKILEVGQVFEIRALGVRRKGSHGSMSAFGVFDSILKATGEVDRFLKEFDASGVYFTPNPLIPAVLSRRANTFDVGSKSDTMAGDNDVLKRNWLLIDLDPWRPAGVTASDEEVCLAKESARKLFPLLTVHLNAEPLVLESGNGVHMMFRCDLPREDDGLISRCLMAVDRLHEKLGIKGVKVDLVNSNPARIWKLPGSVARKGDELPSQSRFHRQARLLYAPKELQPISRMKLESFAVPAKTEHPRRTETPSVTPREQTDAREWLGTHGIAISHTKPWHDANAYVLAECPFDSGHRSPDSMLLQFSDGRIVFYCSHNSCRSKGWFDFREMIEPGWREKRKLVPGFGSEVQSERQRQILRSMMREEWLLFRETCQKGNP
jgi:hypothetical protein